MVAMQRLRDDPSMLDDVFHSLVEDDVTKGEYGDAQIASAKEWFLSQDIPIFMSFRIDDAKCPCISISLQESTEAEQTHGDVHYVPQEYTEADWPAITDRFDVSAYAPSSGMISIPASALTGGLVLGAGMTIADAQGRRYPILEVLDDLVVAIAPNTIANFRGAVLYGTQPKLISTIESVNFRETYVVGCHVMGNSTFLTYLHSIVLYCLMKYKQELMEARGLERTTLSSSDFRRNDLTKNELMFSRAVIVNGFVRQSWRKSKDERIQATDGHFIFEKLSFTGDPVDDLIEEAANGYSVENSD